ncbi:MAG: lipopolysaccharide transport periplasmic protein LptA [Rickettsiales bacterium]|nr:lipopolysaccharide transport periplasmic protein LptA [Rickettsiales bacterium]
MKYFIIIFLALFSFQALSQQGVEKEFEKNQDKPINIKSESLSINNKDNIAVFKQDVVVVQGTMTIKADEMKVFSDLDKKTQKNKFKRIESYGNVHLTSDGREAKAQTGIYDVVNQKIEMYGNVFLSENGNTLQGNKFIYDLKTNLTSITNSGDFSSNQVEKPQEIIQNEDGTSYLKQAFDGVSMPQSVGVGRVKVEFTPGESMKQFDIPKPPIQIKSSTEQRRIVN